MRTLTYPTQEALAEVLAAAGAAHHNYEVGLLGGQRDENWAGFYAAFALGRLGDFATASTLSRWLTEAPSGDNWPALAASHALDALAM